MSFSQVRSNIEKAHSTSEIKNADIINMPRFKADGTPDLRYGSTKGRYKRVYKNGVFI